MAAIWQWHERTKTYSLNTKVCTLSAIIIIITSFPLAGCYQGISCGSTRKTTSHCGKLNKSFKYAKKKKKMNKLKTKKKKKNNSEPIKLKHLVTKFLLKIIISFVNMIYSLTWKTERLGPCRSYIWTSTRSSDFYFQSCLDIV